MNNAIKSLNNNLSNFFFFCNFYRINSTLDLNSAENIMLIEKLKVESLEGRVCFIIVHY